MWRCGCYAGFTADVAAPPIWSGRCLGLYGSSRLISPFKYGSMANALISIWPEQVPELIPVADAA